MTKLDLFREHKREYVMPKSPAFVDVGRAAYLAFEGRGTAGGREFQDAVAELYRLAFSIKMKSKKAGRDYAIAKLEGQWWAPDDLNHWRLLIRTPDFAEEFGAPLLHLEEGRCVQLLHRGPYNEEAEDIAAMHAFAVEQGYQVHGLHHEIYLSDPRKVQPAALKTLLRQPVRK